MKEMMHMNAHIRTCLMAVLLGGCAAGTAQPTSDEAAPAASEAAAWSEPGTVAAIPQAPATTGSPVARAEERTAGTDWTRRDVPVRVSARLGAGSAALSVDFLAPARGVEVTLGGTDGLVVTSERTLVRDGTFATREGIDAQVTFLAPKRLSNLAVYVSGEFNGRQQTAARSFRVVPDGVSPRPEPPPGIATTVDGERPGWLMPAGTP